MPTFRPVMTNLARGARLEAQPPAEALEALYGEEFKVINVYDQCRYQTIDGFGGAFTEAAALTLAKLPGKAQEEFFRLCFDSKEGLGYRFCRTHIGSCDFSLENYSYAEKPGDTALAHFSIDRDKDTLLPMIRRAREYAPDLVLFASPWSPPAWMKDTGKMDNGGRLLPEYYGVYARYLARYVKAYGEQGVDVWGITMQNEADGKVPWESCLYSAREERDFIKNHLGPVFAREGLGHVRLMFWDHNREKALERAQAVLDDPEAARYVDGIAVHWYTGDHFNALSMVHEKYPDKAIRFTEGCAPHDPAFSKRGNGEWYAHDIIGCLNNHVRSWTDWNLLLDEEGGPNHLQNWCDAPLIGHRRTKSLIKESSYYYMAHFSRYIRPGSIRLGSSSYHPALETLAAVNPDGQRVCVVLNRSEDDMDFILRYNERGATLHSPAHTILTILL